MAGRKTIMVDGGVWNKVEELKHNACLRSSSDAIETAVDIVTSDKYYAGIKAQENDYGLFSYVVESLGRTEDEAVRNLLIFEQDSVYGNLRAENIPPVDDVDITKPGFFVVECTKELYHAGKLFDDPETFKLDFVADAFIGLQNPFTCTISKIKNGTLIADIQETKGNTYYVLVDRPYNGKIARIVDYGTSPISLHDEFFVDYTMAYEEGDCGPRAYSNYNAAGYEILRCTPRLFAECIDHIFQSRVDLELEAITAFAPSEEEIYPEYFGILREEKDERTGEISSVVDTTPEGHYYAYLTKRINGNYNVQDVGDTANKAGRNVFISHPIFHLDNVDGNLCIGKGDSRWSTIKENGERIGRYNKVDICLVECTVEVYAKHLMKKENEAVICTIEEVDGHKLAKFKQMENTSKETSEKTTDKKSDSKKRSVKKTADEKTNKSKTKGGKK